jgi:NAD(P)H dehydrogenase (quinone)
MRVLIVFAHPEPRSFNGALANLAVETLTAAGHEVRVSDLYAMKFGAVVSADDFLCDRADPEFFAVAHEQKHAFEQRAFVEEIAAEQSKVLWAELVIFQFPMWWFGMPAILKGWVDRVFARGFAYIAGRKYDTGLLAGRLAMVSTTTGTSAATYAPDGIDGDVNDILWPIHNGIFRYTGFDVLPPHVAYMPGKVGAEERAAYLDSYRRRLLDIERTPRLFFHPVSDYGAEERLKPGVVARSGFQRNV